MTGDLELLDELLNLGYSIDAQNEWKHKSWAPWALDSICVGVHKLQGDRSGNLVESLSVGQGSTALMIAAFSGQVIAVRRLLAAKADITKKNIQGRTALHLAASKGHDLNVEALLASGAAVDELDKKGMTAAMLARRRGHFEVEQRLLAAGG